MNCGFQKSGGKQIFTIVIHRNLIKIFPMKKKTPGNYSRRDFLRDASLVGGGFMIVPRHVLGKGFIAPSDKLNIAGIGVGGKGEVNLHRMYQSVHLAACSCADVYSSSCHL